MSKGHLANADQADSETLRIARLVQQAQAGDRLAFHQLVDRYHPEIFRMLYYRTRSKMDAEDLTQDVFLRAFKHLGRLESAQVFRSWLYRIAVNRVRDFYRHKKMKAILGFESMDADGFRETEAMAVAPQASAGLNREAFWARVKEMMGALSKMEREVFFLRFFDELSIKEITAALGKNESTIKTHLYRALTKVKSAAADMEGLMESL